MGKPGEDELVGAQSKVSMKANGASDFGRGGGSWEGEKGGGEGWEKGRAKLNGAFG